MNSKRMLVCDIDDTLLKDGLPTKGLAPLKTMMAIHREDFYLVYASGRSAESIRELVESGILPEPDAIAPSIGTEIWFSPWGSQSQIYRRWIIGAWDRAHVESIVGAFKGLRLQEPEFQTESKISFYMDSEFAFIKAQLEEQLEEFGLEVRVVYSCGKYLDVLPLGAGKRSAVNYLRTYWSVEGRNTLVCGDSGNDIDMLADPFVNSLVVSNAQPDLDDITNMAHVYRSKLPYAAGVLEGAYVNGMWSRFGHRTPTFHRKGVAPSSFRAVS